MGVRGRVMGKMDEWMRMRGGIIGKRDECAVMGKKEWAGVLFLTFQNQSTDISFLHLLITSTNHVICYSTTARVTTSITLLCPLRIHRHNIGFPRPKGLHCSLKRASGDFQCHWGGLSPLNFFPTPLSFHDLRTVHSLDDLLSQAAFAATTAAHPSTSSGPTYHRCCSRLQHDPRDPRSRYHRSQDNPLILNKASLKVFRSVLRD
ncbi:hypothetical protein B0O80DRAFT_283718 [Mortierella sp. GBAus27b]|nr:hypothetical protein B0O80DRAFT_283718 [Mortierella sp. GBAus27b]